ncbi:MAG TPA: hypothetical protein VMS78_14285, partial [Rhizomicrobium sp.]|nr:hypothetical protein [Rhizomicrobium sp.]
GGEWLREQSPQEASENEYRTSNLRFQGLMLIFFFYLTQRLRPKAKKKAADCSAALGGMSEVGAIRPIPE